MGKKMMEKGMGDDFRDRLLNIRQALELSQRDFCKGIYVSQSYFSQIERGQKPLNERIAALICTQYGISKEYLLTGGGEMFSEFSAEVQLNQLLEIFNQLDQPFKEHIILQIKQLLETQNKSKKQKKV